MRAPKKPENEIFCLGANLTDMNSNETLVRKDRLKNDIYDN